MFRYLHISTLFNDYEYFLLLLLSGGWPASARISRVLSLRNNKNCLFHVTRFLHVTVPHPDFYSTPCAPREDHTVVTALLPLHLSTQNNACRTAVPKGLFSFLSRNIYWAPTICRSLGSFLFFFFFFGHMLIIFLEFKILPTS